MPFPPIMGAGIGLPGTPQEDFIRQQAQAKRMFEFDVDSKFHGLEEDPTATGFAHAFDIAERYGFGPPPDVPTYSGWTVPGGGGWPAVDIQPGEVDPGSGWRLTRPDNLEPNWDTAPIEDRMRWEKEVKERGEYVPPPPEWPRGPIPQFPNKGVPEPVPTSKVYSAPIGELEFPWRRQRQLEQRRRPVDPQG